MGPSNISSRQKKVALAIAATADIIQIFFTPLFFEGAASPLDDGLDLVVALVLIFVLGFRWRFVVALGAELMPVMAIFPTWTLFVATLPTATATMGTLKVETLPRAAPQLESMEDRTHM